MGEAKGGTVPSALEGQGPLRVLISLHRGGGDGAVFSALHLALGLARRGVEVRFVCPPGSPVEAEARDRGLAVHPLPLALNGRFTNARLLAELLARQPVDLINPHNSRDREAFGWLGFLGRLPAPLVMTRHSFPRSTRLEQWLGHRATARVIAVSQPIAAELRRRGTPASRIRVVRNGVILDRVDRPVSPDEVAAWRRRIGWEPGRRTVGIVSRPKDQEVVLRALSLVRTPVRLVLAGLDGPMLEGPLPPVPERHAVVRLPFDPAIRPLYQLLDLALHASRWEGVPLGVLDAMALGKPVIASRAGWSEDVIRDGVDGCLVEPTDPAAWAEALDRLLHQPGLAASLGAAARERVRQEFSLERTVEGTLAVYDEVLGRVRRAPVA